MLSPKPLIIAVCCALAIVVGVYLVGYPTLEQNILDDPSTTSTEKPTIPTVEQKQQPTAKGPWHGGEPHEDDTKESSQPVATTQAKPSLEEEPTPEERAAFKKALAEKYVPLWIEQSQKSRKIVARLYQNMLNEQKRNLGYQQRTGRRATHAEYVKRRLTELKTELDATDAEIAHMKNWRKQYYENQNLSENQ